MIGSDFYIDLLAKDLEGNQRRFRAISQNMANASTPSYKAVEVTFEDQLREFLGTDRRRLALSTTSDRHFPNIPMSLEDVVPVAERDPTISYRNDRNNVDPEIEMAKLATTRMADQAYTRFMSKRIQMLKTAIVGK